MDTDTELAGPVLRPDYTRSIVNLISGLAAAAGGGPQMYQSLPELDNPDLSGRQIVLLVIDGLGDSFLRSRPDSFLCRHRRGRLTSVFPTTTATAVTSFFTGTAPRQHAITGWHTYLRELGAVATILPFVPRYGGPCLSHAGISPEQVVSHGLLLAHPGIRSHVLLPHYLLDSAYSRGLSGRALRHGCNDLTDMFSRLAGLAEEQGNALIIAYWPELDGLAHEHGTRSVRTAEHFLEIDRLCLETLPRTAEAGAAVFVTSDHGLIDTDPEHTILLEDHPELAATLILPLCGEPRCAYCYVRPDSEAVFVRYVREKLGHACQLRKSASLIEQGFFGTGTSSPRLAERVGDYTLLMKDRYIIKDRLANEKTHQQIGVHGGLSEEELYVPLIFLAE